MDPSAPCDVDWAANYDEQDHGPLPWPLGIVGPRRQCGFLVEVEVDGGSGCVVDGAVVMAYGEVQSGYVRIDLCGFREVPRPPPGTHLLVKADPDSTTGTTLVPTEPAAVAALRPWTPSAGTLPRFGLRYGPRDQPLPELVVCPLAGCDEAVAASWWGEWRARALDWTAHWTCAPTMPGAVAPPGRPVATPRPFVRAPADVLVWLGVGWSQPDVRGCTVNAEVVWTTAGWSIGDRLTLGLDAAQCQYDAQRNATWAVRLGEADRPGIDYVATQLEDRTVLCRE